MLVSMALVFYCSHPLSHYIVGKIYGINTKFFFLGKSDFRKLNGALGKLGGMFPTIGIKLDPAKVAGLPRGGKKGFLFGSGAIVSSAVIVIPIAIAAVTRFSLIALVIGLLFFLWNLSFELAFSTKTGDLAKMRRAL
ncbi:MAG: hypothetical protein ACREBS_10620 [Nitrososphaerales archaeon]